MAQQVRLVVAVQQPEERAYLSSALTGPDMRVLGETGNGQTALLLVSQLKPDVIVLDSDLEGLDGLNAARQLLQDQSVAVVMLVHHHHLAAARSLAETGAACCLIRPCSPQQLDLAVAAAARARAERLALLKRAQTAERRLADRQYVERAKALLMAQERISEEEAYVRLRHMSMKSRRSMGDVAHMLLLNHSLRST